MNRRDPVAQSRSSAARIRLSCEECRQRKKKCDRLSPCSSCLRVGLACHLVERARLPRGWGKAPQRSHDSDKELADRVANLEQLLERVCSGRDGSTSGAPPSAIPGSDTELNFGTKMPNIEAGHDQHVQSSKAAILQHQTHPPKMYLASSFWGDIMEQTQELRTVLNDRLGNEQREVRQPFSFGTSISGPESPESIRNSTQPCRDVRISAQTRRTLCDIYLRNVDPLFKILHRPALKAFLYNEKPYLDYDMDHQAPATLACAVYYAAVCTIDNSHCQLLFGTDRNTVLAELRRETECMLEKADFVATNELTVLQAYVLSLLAARCQDQSRRVWTMLAMAVRVGQALCLHMSDPPFQINSFERELRRRTWQAIGVLDLAASLDRASEPMMQSAWLVTHPPANINDEDIWYNMDETFEERPKSTFTDMTYTLIVAEAQTVARSILFTDFTEEAAKSMRIRQEKVYNFQQKVSTLLNGCTLEQAPFQVYVRRTANTLHSWLQLGNLRPISRSQNFKPPSVMGNWLLELAADNLKKAQSLCSDPAMAPWEWYGSLWVPWHGLAVALAEMCVCKDMATFSMYWPIVEEVYYRSSFVIADSRHGMLWKPLEKLMNQAQAHRRELINRESLGKVTHHLPVGGTSLDPVSDHPSISVKAGRLRTQSMITPQMDLNTLNIADGQQFDNAFTMPQTSTSFEPFPNIWEDVEFSTGGSQGTVDENAWVYYDNFISDLHDSSDSMFFCQ